MEIEYPDVNEHDLGLVKSQGWIKCPKNQNVQFASLVVC